MTPYRQPIIPGDQGSDVLAVKRAMRAMGVKGSGGLVLSKKAGPAFITVLNYILRQHGKASDGVYGPGAHAIIAPHFDAYGVALYKAAKIRTHVPPPSDMTATEAAKTLLGLHAAGKFSDDRGTCLPQIQKAAAGQAIWSPMGRYVHLDRRWMDAIITLIQTHGMKIGVYAICSDHHYDSPRGHSGGAAADISSVNGVSVAAGNAYTPTLTAALTLHGLAAALHPWQLICGGYGNHRNANISAYSIPGADSFYGPATMAEHCGHLHLGYEV